MTRWWYLLADICWLKKAWISKRIDFEAQIPAVFFIMPLSFHLLTNDYWLASFEVHLVEGLP